MFDDAIEAVLADHAPPAVVRAIEQGGAPDALWDRFASAGFLELLAAEEAGGAALPLTELFPVLLTLGRHGVPLPVAQTIASRALLGSDAPGRGRVTLATTVIDGAGGALRLPTTPFARIAEHVIVARPGAIELLSCTDAERGEPMSKGSALATLAWPQAPRVVARVTIDHAEETVAAWAAALHAGLIAGALNRVFEMTLTYCNERSQFGRSIGKFQAIQHQCSVMAEHVAAATVAAESAFDTDARAPRLLPAAMAKARASEAAALVANLAHGLHGAIGVTEEYDLQLLTRRLHEWRVAHGSEDHWHRVVGRAVLAGTEPSVADFVRAN